MHPKQEASDSPAREYVTGGSLVKNKICQFENNIWLRSDRRDLRLPRFLCPWIRDLRFHILCTFGSRDLRIPRFMCSWIAGSTDSEAYVPLEPGCAASAIDVPLALHGIYGSRESASRKSVSRKSASRKSVSRKSASREPVSRKPVS